MLWGKLQHRRAPARLVSNGSGGRFRKLTDTGVPQVNKEKAVWNRFQRTRGLAASLLLAAYVSGCGGTDSGGAASKQASEAESPAAAVTNSSTSADQLQMKNETEGAPAAGQAQVQNEKGIAPAAGGGGSGAMTAQPAPAVQEAPVRQIIYKANLTMRVDTYSEAVAKIQEVVRQSGAYVLSSSENTAGADKSGSFVIKVPARGFQPLIQLLEGIDPQLQRSVEGQDVTEEFVDLTARLKAKQAVEARLLSFIEKAEKADELVAFSAELGKVQEDIERITGRMRYLEQHVAYSTVELRVEQKVTSADRIQSVERGPLWTRASEALQGSAAFMVLLLEGLVVFLAGALPVLPLAAGVGGLYWFYRRWRRRRRSISSPEPVIGSYPVSSPVGDIPKDEPKESEK
ncbi:hypothetical protein B2K_28110 [Paenibacillus mucilaginosus K02]|uniref:DUF4349 domain-containing protein n=1 Tax=Paenibacillus mucilaginosus K02 TaxID=997761 RepID=I0BQ69_9BACL|nr:hypothetical protein B2K_28110 [Paenibacillus mucilaginosus K02]